MRQSTRPQQAQSFQTDMDLEVIISLPWRRGISPTGEWVRIQQNFDGLHEKFTKKDKEEPDESDEEPQHLHKSDRQAENKEGWQYWP